MARMKAIITPTLLGKFPKGCLDFPGGSNVVKNWPCSEGDQGLLPGSGRSPEKGKFCNLFQYSCQENSVDRGPGRRQTMSPKAQTTEQGQGRGGEEEAV